MHVELREAFADDGAEGERFVDGVEVACRVHGDRQRGGHDVLALGEHGALEPADVVDGRPPREGRDLVGGQPPRSDVRLDLARG